MSLTKEDKNDIQGIVREEVKREVHVAIHHEVSGIVPGIVRKEVQKAIQHQVPPIVEQITHREIGPLRDMLESNDRKLDAMVELFSPLLYGRHRISDFKLRMERVESDVAALRQQVV